MTLVALAVFIVAVAAAITFVIVRGIDLWRALRAFFSTVGEGSGELAESLDRLAAHEQPELERLQASTERLRRSRAQLLVLSNALKRVREQAAGTFLLVPRK